MLSAVLTVRKPIDDSDTLGLKWMKLGIGCEGQDKRVEELTLSYWK